MVDKETKEYFDTKVEEFKRYVGILSESFQSKLDVVIEGHEVIRKELKDFREENQHEHEEIKAMIRFSYVELDKRIKFLESEFSVLKTRVDKLETQKHT
jgi:hypothetical protein